ncbi:4416_t:CDS:2 [Entrophospora sp. SA101]|nr:4416_t:CDS:2 [Entrophospora sp. SA101]
MENGVLLLDYIEYIHEMGEQTKAIIKNSVWNLKVSKLNALKSLKKVSTQFKLNA